MSPRPMPRKTIPVSLALLLLSSTACVTRSTRNLFATASSLANQATHSEIAADLVPARLRAVGDCFVLEGHAVEPGDDWVLGIYDFRAIWLIADGASYEYLTIQLPGGAARGRRVQFPSEGTAFYSSGAPSFPSRSGCVGYASAGHVELKRMGSSRIRADLDLEVQSISPRDYQGACGPKRIRKTVSFRRVEVWPNPACIASRTAR